MIRGRRRPLPALFFYRQNRLPHLRDGQPVDRAPEKKRGTENFDGAKLTGPPIFHGEFTANAVDLARQ